MAKRKETLEEGLDRSANKKGLTGKARKRYIGGTLENLSKKGRISLRRVSPPKRQREKLVLVVKKNASASKTRAYDVYSIYKEGNSTPYNDSTFRKRAVAVRAAADEMHAYNNRFKQRKMSV